MDDHQILVEGLVCPVPLPHTDQIVMGHGSGGRMSHDLIKNIFLDVLDNPVLNAGNDAAACTVNEHTRLAVSTDSHVVSPLFFPGGDIGRLAVCGTVNDVAMLGAIPLYLTAGFILEEGLDVNVLNAVVASMKHAAEEAGIQLVAGDTKVVQKGKADGLYINTCGIGIIPSEVRISGEFAQPGDAVLISGPIGDHGMAVLAARGELGIETDLSSDVAPLNSLVQLMLKTSDRIHVLRDPTRGGVATSLNEIALQSKVSIFIQEELIPIKPAVSAICELFGFDPLYVANEGKLLAIVHPQDADSLVRAMRTHPLGAQTAQIGYVKEVSAGRVAMQTKIGTMRMVDMLAGEMLPRIC